MSNIIWLASYPKSGNIWLQAFLYNLISDAHQTPSAEIIRNFCTPEAAALHFMKLDSRPLSAWSRNETAERRAAAHQTIAELRSDNVFASTQAALASRGGSATITMEHTTAAIYLVRNPLDLALSLAAADECSIDDAILRLETEYESENSDQFAYEFHGSWSTHVLSWTQQRHAGLHLLRYEDMLSVPEKSFGPVATFFGFDASPARIDRAIRYSTFDNLAVEQEKSTYARSTEASTKLLRVGKSDQWRGVLSADQVRRVVERHAEQMERFGYIPDAY
ncbi:MAG: sulfotransferase domain-containing protein [Proteobacteria bacterium]|nr:sulfotransferase domain-containing protein [Pseudomonadota bacterium]MDA1356540.1 sulfotransferase domain-containing protein [Pseudomonadota bacterium]